MKSLLMAFPWAKLVIHEEEEGKDACVSETCAATYGPLLMEKKELDDVCEVSVSISREAQLGGHVEYVGGGEACQDPVCFHCKCEKCGKLIHLHALPIMPRRAVRSVRQRT